jgi:hypothetical protein
MEVGSSGGPDKNPVYGLSNTTTENLLVARSVSTVGSSQSVSSTQSKEFVALQQHTTHLTKKYNQLSAYYEQNTAHTAHLTEKYKQLLANYKQLRQMVMNIACKARPPLSCRILSAMTLPNPASTPHDFVSGSPQAPKHVLQG